MKKYFYIWAFIPLLYVTGITACSLTDDRDSALKKHSGEEDLSFFNKLLQSSSSSSSSCSSAAFGESDFRQIKRRRSRDADTPEDREEIMLFTQQQFIQARANGDSSEAMLNILMKAKQELQSQNLQDLLNSGPVINYFHELVDQKKYMEIPAFDQNGLIPVYKEDMPANRSLLEALGNIFMRLKTADGTIFYMPLTEEAAWKSETINTLKTVKNDLPGIKPWSPVNMEGISATALATIAALRSTTKTIFSKQVAAHADPSIDTSDYRRYLLKIANTVQFSANELISIDFIRELFNAIGFLDITDKELITAAGSATIKWTEDPRLTEAERTQRWVDLNQLPPYIKKWFYTALIENNRINQYTPLYASYMSNLYNKAKAFSISVQDLIDWSPSEECFQEQYYNSRRSWYDLKNLYIRDLTGLDKLPCADAVLGLDLRYNRIETLPNNIFERFPRLTRVSLSKNQIKTVDPNAFKGSNGWSFIDL
jgi:hypothetical protein